MRRAIDLYPALALFRFDNEDELGRDVIFLSIHDRPTAADPYGKVTTRKLIRSVWDPYVISGVISSQCQR